MIPSEETPTPGNGDVEGNPASESPETNQSAAEAAPTESGDKPAYKDPVVPPSAKTALQEFEVQAPLTEEDEKSPYSFYMPGYSFSTSMEIVSTHESIDLRKSESGRKWIDAFTGGHWALSRGGQFESTLDRAGSKYEQAIKSEKGPLGLSIPKLNEPGVSGVTGQRAVLRVRALMGMGTIMHIPLWHSGFWISIKAPSDAEFLELDRKITEEKIQMGRQTHGLAYSNEGVYYTQAVMDMVFNNFFDSTLKESNIENVRSKISMLDIPLIAWGLACVIWPRGFPHTRAIVRNGVEETVSEKLNITKMTWTDSTRLTAWQIAHMANRSGNTMTNESLERYRTEFTHGKGREIDLGNDLKMTLRIPNMDTYIASGQQWIASIVAMVDQAFGMDDDVQRRDQYIYEQGRAVNMRQYGHMVENFIMPDGQIYADQETVMEILDTLSENDAVRPIYFKACREYQEEATMSLIAIPAHTTEEKGPLPRWPRLLPIDPLSVFFFLVAQKTLHIQKRL